MSDYLTSLSQWVLMHCNVTTYAGSETVETIGILSTILFQRGVRDLKMCINCSTLKHYLCKLFIYLSMRCPTLKHIRCKLFIYPFHQFQITVSGFLLFNTFMRLFHPDLDLLGNSNEKGYIIKAGFIYRERLMYV